MKTVNFEQEYAICQISRLLRERDVFFVVALWHALDAESDAEKANLCPWGEPDRAIGTQPAGPKMRLRAITDGSAPCQ
jgi:hypothetical protein